LVLAAQAAHRTKIWTQSTSGWLDTLVDAGDHPGGQVVVEVGEEDALLDAFAEIEEGLGEAVAALVVGYIVTDDVLHGGSGLAAR
jgi:hypothetical protein